MLRDLRVHCGDESMACTTRKALVQYMDGIAGDKSLSVNLDCSLVPDNLLTYSFTMDY
jgi:hypothetical protein